MKNPKLKSINLQEILNGNEHNIFRGDKENIGFVEMEFFNS